MQKDIVMSRRGLRHYHLLFIATAWLLFLTGTIARSQVCDVLLKDAGAGGFISARTINRVGSNFVSDPELDIEIAADLSFVRLENSKIRVVYSGFIATHPEYAITEFVIKEANEDQLSGSGDFLAAGAGRGPIVSATLVVDEEDRKTVRLQWSRWDITNQRVEPADQILIDVTIYPHQPFLQFENLDIQWHATVVDLATPGGTTNGVHIAHGAVGWNRGYVTHDEAPYLGSYYNRYGPDAVNDPTNGGSLDYNGHFIVAVSNPLNGRGFGRVVPVADTSIVKLLLGPQTRRGLETAHHPFFNPHLPFTTYLFAIETGSDPLTTGRALADSGGIQPKVECGDTLELTAQSYTDFLFSNWTDDLTGDFYNPTFTGVVAPLVVGARFDQAPGDYTNNFDTALLGNDPIGWFDTGSNNSLLENDAFFEVLDTAGERAFGTTLTFANIHSHYLGSVGAGGIGYEFSGRLKITDFSSGIGVTVFSQYPNSATYYRLGRFAGGPFRLDSIGTGLSGMTDTGIIPLPDIWYRFRIQAEDTGTRTDIRAMVWKDGFAEPLDWQVQAFDDSATRMSLGSPGLWSTGLGSKYLDDVAIHALQPPPTNLLLGIQTVGSGSVVVTPDQAQYTQGDIVNLGAVASAGEVFAGWSGDLSGFENPTQLRMLGDQTVTAAFVVPTIHTLTLNATGLGQITANPAQTQYLLGDVVELTANPAPGSSLVAWSGALQGSQNPQMLTITGDLQVGASFVEFNLIENFDSVLSGGNAPEFFDTAAANSLVQDDTLYSVGTLNGTQVLTSTSTQIDTHSHYTGIQLNGLGGYEFSGRMQMTDLAGGVGVTFFSQFPGAFAYYRLRSLQGTRFHLSPAGTSLAGITDTGVLPVANIWYQFRIEVDAGPSSTEVRAKVWPEGSPEPAQWQAQASDSSATRLTWGTIGVWSMGAGVKYWDDFKVRPLPNPAPTLALDLSVIGKGRVQATPAQSLYSPGDPVNLTAIPDPGHVFLGWLGAASGSNPSVDIVINASASVVARFAEILPYALTVHVLGDGTGNVTRSPDQTRYLTGDGVTLTATPAPGSVFAGWGGDVSGSQNPLQLTVLAPTSVVASFVLPTYANDFESSSVGTTPAGWFDTGGNNSLVGAPGLFNVRTVANQQALGTDSTLTNVHSHWLGTGSNSLTNYRYTGRFRMTDNGSGVGITALSQFPDRLAYYRLRRYRGTNFHLAPIGTSFTSGTTDTGILPVAHVWYRFVMEVEDTGTETRVRAKVWQEGDPEPPFFQADAVDSSPSRLRTGTFGVWSTGLGSKFVDDVRVFVPEADGVAMWMAALALLGRFARLRRSHFAP